MDTKFLNNSIGVQTPTEIDELKLKTHVLFQRLSDQHPVLSKLEKIGCKYAKAYFIRGKEQILELIFNWNVFKVGSEDVIGIFLREN